MAKREFDPAKAVQKFLNSIESRANRLPDPFGEDLMAPGAKGARAPSLRVRGLLAQLSEQNREITRAKTRDQGALVAERRVSGTIFGNRWRELFRKAEADRAAVMEDWYRSLSHDDRKAVEGYWFAAAEAIIRRIIPRQLPEYLHGPLGCLALEYAGIVRRAAAEREELSRWLALGNQKNQTVVNSILGGVTREEQEAKSRLIGRWYRQLPTEQPALASQGRQAKRTGRPPIGQGKQGNKEAEIAKRNAYAYIQSKKVPGLGPGGIFHLVKNDKQLKELVETAGAKLSVKFIRAALKARKSTKVDHETFRDKKARP
jgi:hypothetical protein